MEPVPDERWLIVNGINNYQQYLEKIGPPILLKEVVDQDVRGIFRLVNKLIFLSYYEYEFWDLASMKALLAFELALKKRYVQLNQEGLPMRINLKKLIEWFRLGGYFETDSEHYLDQIRIIRNHFAHPDFHSIAGPIVSWHIYAAAGLINDLYEDRELRQSRKQEIFQLNEKLQKLQETGMILTIDKTQPILVYRFMAGFINNKGFRKEYYFIYKPMFIIPEEFKKGDSVPVYDAYQVSCTNYTLIDTGELIGFDNNGKQVFTLTVLSADAKLQWDNWYSEYREYIKVLPHFSITDNRSIGEVIGEIKWRFHY